MTGGRREELLEALATYRREERQDEAAVSRFQSFLERDDPFRRGDPDGHVTASAIVARPGKHFEFLLVFHRKLDRWLQPGGHVEESDRSVFDAALREAREETGIEGLGAPIGDAILDVDIHAIPAFGNEPAHLHYDVRYLLTAKAALSPARGSVWFSRAAVTPQDMDGSLVRAVAKAALRLSRL